MNSIPQEILGLLGDWRVYAAIAVTALAGVMRGYSGFGTAVLLAPAYSVLWGPRIGVPVMLLMELVVSMQLVPKAIGEANRRVILPIGAAACVATPLGAFILITADQDLLRRFIGGFVLVFGLLLMSGWRYHGSRPLPLNLAVGSVAGLLKGATGISGPPVILYLLAGPEAVKQHRANLILFFGTIAVISVIPPALGGLIVWSTLAKLLILLPVLMLGVPLGARLFHVLPDRWYRRAALFFLVTTGIIALLA
ncbi:sulfite exporter TauE/SafE family protein [Falsiroseomonas sp.]|uniref:sulfite exporter TauE/SafE family protein n=1 Tax=Falsiroseomonas sp. TaxID=2870721 RepID=UPI0027232798|nr:sulfite exporter TauE/SafE family protein [Falsiroseomonas sp.]MDO9499515.1 sulfite exporter TauE/SafE family protein [Falsiroseomonas sp.]